MATKTKELSLGEHKYMITQFTADKSTVLLVKLAHIVGESISLFAAAGNGSEVRAAIPKALTAAIYRMNPAETLGLLKELMSCVVVIGQGSQTVDQIYNIHFQGRIGDVMILAKEVINHNYENFFDVVASLVPSEGPATKNPGT